MPVWVGGRGWVVNNVAVEIEALRVAEMRVWHGHWLCCPIRRHEPAEAAAVVAGPEHVQAGFGIAFFAGELAGRGHTLDSITVHGVHGVVRVGAGFTSRIRCTTNLVLKAARCPQPGW